MDQIAKPSYVVHDHSGDIRIEAHGEDFLEALAIASAGLVAQIVNPDTIVEREERSISVQGDDDVERAVAFLNELLYLVNATHWLPRRVRVLTECGNKGCTSLNGVLVGEKVDPQRHEFKFEIKAVTYHEFKIEKKNHVCIEFVCDL